MLLPWSAPSKHLDAHNQGWKKAEIQLNYYLPIIDKQRTIRSLQVWELCRETFTPEERAKVEGRLLDACQRFEIDASVHMLRREREHDQVQKPAEAPLTFAEYHKLIDETAAYPDVGNNIVYPALGLAGEAGEVANKVKKLWRDHEVTGQKQLFTVHADPDRKLMRLELRDKIMSEIGDCLWYLDALATELGTTLEECGRENMTKIRSRAARGTIHGSGDHR